MSPTVRIIFGVFIILHGLVHPIMAIVPQPIAEQSETNPPAFGGFWTHSWLLGEGPDVKNSIYLLSTLTAVVLLIAGIGFVSRYRLATTMLLVGTVLSITLLFVFWNKYFIVGVAIDGLLIISALTTTWLSN